MAIHLVCYADERFLHAQQRLIRSGLKYGIDFVHKFNPESVRKTLFYHEHRAILDQKRGSGYWLWKPYLVQQVLNEASAGDVVLYVDSGVEIIAPVYPLAEACRLAGGTLLFRNHLRANRYWVKRDCFVLMNCDSDSFYDADSVNAAFCGFISGSRANRFVDEWLNHCTDARKLTDIPNECGLPNLPDYLEHRHDQAVLSLLAVARGISLHRDPSQLGNHLKPAEFRVADEELEFPYCENTHIQSNYPTIFNHHRETTVPTSVARRAVVWAKKLVRQWSPKKISNPYFCANDLAQAVARNKVSLAEIKDWYDPAADAASQFGYGVPPRCRHLLSRPVGSHPTLPDLIVHLADHFSDRLNYLEIGVSVGKNFHQIMRAARGRSLTGFDIENIHPNLSSRLEEVSRTSWSPSIDSLKREMSSYSEFWDPVGRNRVRYLAGDVLNEDCWAMLRGQKFNFIFSDALHRPEGLMHEWRMIERFGLLDDDEFVFLWDDLGGIMSLAFDRIADQLQSRNDQCVVLRFQMRGWMGVNEHPHQIGAIINLRDPPAWLGRLRVGQNLTLT